MGRHEQDGQADGLGRIIHRMEIRPAVIFGSGLGLRKQRLKKRVLIICQDAKVGLQFVKRDDHGDQVDFFMAITFTASGSTSLPSTRSEPRKPTWPVAA